MRTTILGLLTIGILAVLIFLGTVMASTVSGGNDDSGLTEIASIAENPNEWLGKEVTVEGLVVRTFPTWFVMYGEKGPSITVKTTDIIPLKGRIVRVNGTVGIQSLYGDEQAYIFAQSYQ